MKSEKGRENFGVWQLPLFNHVEPECQNYDNFLGIQGRRGLNTQISEILPV